MKSWLGKSQAGVKIAGRNINNLRNVDDTTLMVGSKQEQKGLLLRMKEENEKAGLKLSIQKMKITTSGLITSCQIEGGKVKAMTHFISWALKSLWTVTAAMKLKDSCSLQGKL